MSDSAPEALNKLLSKPNIFRNLSTAKLVEQSLSRGEAQLASNGAVVGETGKRTGRSPGDKFVVDRPGYHDRIWWGKVNQPLATERFEALRARVGAYLQG